MINVIVVADDIASDFGDYFRLAHNHLALELDATEVSWQTINGQDCHPAAVEAAITSLQEKPFVFVGYSHGKHDALVSTAAQDGYVNSKNAYCFGTSLFYTTSCLSARTLKQLLIESNCYAYVGYNDNIEVPVSAQDQRIFITCENRALVHFLTTDDTLTESVAVMEKYHKQQFNAYLESQEYVTGSLLMQNFSCLVFHDSTLLRRTRLKRDGG